MTSRIQSSIRGFTIIELVAVLAILSILAVVALPLAELSVQRERERELRQALWQIRDAIDAYKKAGDEGRIVRGPSENGYPPSLQALVEGVPDLRAASTGRLYFLRQIPLDPFGSNEGSQVRVAWGLRSFASPPDAPKEGTDVYDVYSLAEGVGLNGIPYRNW